MLAILGMHKKRQIIDFEANTKKIMHEVCIYLLIFFIEKDRYERDFFFFFNYKKD